MGFLISSPAPPQNNSTNALANHPHGLVMYMVMADTAKQRAIDLEMIFKRYYNNRRGALNTFVFADGSTIGEGDGTTPQVPYIAVIGHDEPAMQRAEFKAYLRWLMAMNERGYYGDTSVAFFRVVVAPAAAAKGGAR